MSGIEFNRFDLLTSMGVPLRVLVDIEPANHVGYPTGLARFCDLRNTEQSADGRPFRDMELETLLKTNPEGVKLDRRNQDRCLDRSGRHALYSWIQRILADARTAEIGGWPLRIRHSWHLPPAWEDDFDPVGQGWVQVHGRLYEIFPETYERPMVTWRDFWQRGDNRLVVEWEIEGQVIGAILLDGKEIKFPRTRAEWDNLWRRSGR